MAGVIRIPPLPPALLLRKILKLWRDPGEGEVPWKVCGSVFHQSSEMGALSQSSTGLVGNNKYMACNPK